MNTTKVLQRPVLIAWIALVGLTLVSWLLSAEFHPDASTELAGVVILAVAAFKVRTIGLYFMELRDAPAALRAVFEFYCVTAFVVLAAVYALG